MKHRLNRFPASVALKRVSPINWVERLAGFNHSVIIAEVRH